MMRKIITVIIVLASLTAKSQVGWYDVFSGDTISLTVTGYHDGTIQWQESTDSLAWTNIPGLTNNVETFEATSSPTGKKYYRAEIVDTLCPNTPGPWYSSVIQYKVITGTTQVVVGDWFHGGRVIYIDGTGEGLIATQQNQSTSAKWGCWGVSIPGATSNSDGAANTAAIVASCSSSPIAAGICDELTMNYYSDWFLPAKDQLNYLYLQKDIVGGTLWDQYWSSTEYNDLEAKRQYFSNGTQSNVSKNTYLYVRCVRSFSPTDISEQTNASATVLGMPMTVTISSQPQSQNKCKGSSVTFSVTTYGSWPSYQWKIDGANITNATNYSYTKSNLSAADEGVYTCEVTNVCRSITTDDAELSVIEISANVGQDLTFCNDTAVQLQANGATNHPAESGALSYLWSPATALSNTVISDPLAQPVSNTTYIVTVGDQLGCSIKDTITLTSKTPVNITTQPVSVNLCKGADITFVTAATGTLPLDYLWKKDGIPIPGATDTSYSVSNADLPDEGIYTFEATNYCGTTVSDDAVLQIMDISVDAGLTQLICSGQTAQLQAVFSTNHTAESGIVAYTWDPSSSLTAGNISNPVATPTTNTTYMVTAADEAGCTASDTVSVNVQFVFQNEQICLVTVDPSVWKNKIIWEKTEGVGSASYNIYKETSTDVYELIGNVPFDSISEIIDYSSTPEAHADKYKISVVDSCGSGTESDLSPYHKTINLVISSFGSTMGLSWTPYQDEIGQFVPSKYIIYRGTQPDNMQPLDSISGSFTSYNDNNVFSVYYYMVGVIRPGGCDIGSKTLYSSSFSNKKDNSTLIGLIEYKGYNTEALSIFPNPFKESTTVKFYNPDRKPFKLIVTDASGRLVRTAANITGNELTIDRK
ncbi:MAG: hypothetical protein KKA07_03530, partial [Bacteroidetes bacterium]|nr:hypothetical protein [Bacteroidota bacterium]